MTKALLLRPDELAARLGVSRRVLYDWLRDDPDPANPMPRPLKLGRATAWRLADIEAWLERKASHAAA